MLLKKIGDSRNRTRDFSVTNRPCLQSDHLLVPSVSYLMNKKNLLDLLSLTFAILSVSLMLFKDTFTNLILPMACCEEMRKALLCNEKTYLRFWKLKRKRFSWDPLWPKWCPLATLQMEWNLSWSFCRERTTHQPLKELDNESWI